MDRVSEELNSVETRQRNAMTEQWTWFQKNLIVWKPRFRDSQHIRLYQFQKNLIVWKLDIKHIAVFGRTKFQKNLIVWKLEK